MGPGGDSGREGGAVGAVIDEPPLQFQGEMSLRTTDENGLQQLTECLVGDLGGDPQTGDLLLVLDQAELLDGATEVGETQPGRDRADGAMPGHGQMVLLDGERLGPLGGGEIGGCDRRIAAGRGQHVHTQGLVRTAALGGPVVLGPRTHEQVLTLSQQQYGSLGSRAREIPHIGGPGDQRSRTAARVTLLPKPRSARRVRL